MRGKVGFIVFVQTAIGITPAYAGKRIILHRDDAPLRDHPRVCGEKRLAAFQFSRSQGSPPRMRGKGVKHRDGRVRVGITPAYAGKSHSLFGTFGAERDHPRVCGEKHEPPCAQGLIVGSPPRMRGKD